MVPSIRSRRVVSNGGHHLFVAYDLNCVHDVVLDSIDFDRANINEAVDSTINQISSSSFEWWSSFVCSLLVALFRKAFELYKVCLQMHECSVLWYHQSDPVE